MKEIQKFETFSGSLLVIEKDVFFGLMKSPKTGKAYTSQRSDVPRFIINVMKCMGEIEEEGGMIIVNYIL